MLLTFKRSLKLSECWEGGAFSVYNTFGFYFLDNFIGVIFFYDKIESAGEVNLAVGVADYLFTGVFNKEESLSST